MKIREVMTPNPVTLDASTPIMKAAEAMRENDIGDVVVRYDGKLCGIVTDRDIVVRVLATGKDHHDRVRLQPRHVDALAGSRHRGRHPVDERARHPTPAGGA